MSVNWIYYPITERPPKFMIETVSVFEQEYPKISSEDGNRLSSNEVLAIVADGLNSLGYKVERGKRAADLIQMPVLFKERGEIEKAFYPDAFNSSTGVVLEVEAGRAYANNQFLKDFFETCMMVDAEYLCIAVRNKYESAGTTTRDFELICTFFKTMYASSRMDIPLRGLLLIGY